LEQSWRDYSREIQRWGLDVCPVVAGVGACKIGFNSIKPIKENLTNLEKYESFMAFAAASTTSIYARQAMTIRFFQRLQDTPDRVLSLRN
jgi:hypothetical protein